LLTNRIVYTDSSVWILGTDKIIRMGSTNGSCSIRNFF